MKRPRPHIPISVRVQVAARQLRERGSPLDRSVLYGLRLLLSTDGTGDQSLSAARKLRSLLAALFGEIPCELHHRPALINRPFNNRTGKYSPPANHPDFLVYLEKEDHRIETYVRGVGAQRSDMGQRKYQRRMDRNRGKLPRKRRYRPIKNRRTKWPSRKFRSRL